MSFHHFYETWFELLQQLVQQLRQVPTPPSAEEHHHQIRSLVQEVISHYTDYYRCKSVASKQDVLALLTAPWTTALERSLHWIAGWRPTTAFHILYTESSILFDSHVVEILRGFHTGDLRDLSQEQFRRVNELQMKTVEQENDITRQLSDWQDDGSNIVETMYEDVDVNIERLVGIVGRADQLRLKTIQSLVDLLTSQQAAQFLLVTADLLFGIRAWGIHQDRQRLNN